MPKETFDGLDKLILDQPEFIDLNQEVVDESKKGDSKEKEEEKKDNLENDGLIEIPEINDEDDSDDDSDDKKKAGKKDDEEEEEEVDDKSKNNSSQEELLKGWGEYFKENEILAEDDLEGFNGTPDSLIEAFKKREIRVGLEMVDDYKSQLPDMLKYLADNWEDGVPLTDLLNIKSNQIRYENITDEKIEQSVDTQKAVYADYLRKTTKYSEAKIEKEVSRLVELDELKDESKDALKELKAIEAEAEEIIKKETKKQREARIEANKKAIQTYEKTAKSIKEVIPGIKIDQKLQEEILRKTIDPVGVDGNGNNVSYIQSIRNEDPYTFDIKLNYLMVLTKGLTDFSKITNTITTKATKDLNKVLNTAAPKGKNNIDASAKKSVLDYLQMPQNRK